MSEETLDKFINEGFIKEYADIYRLDRYEDEIVNMAGFGRRSYDNLIEAVNASRNVPVFKLIYSLGILNVGVANAKMICRHFGNDLDKIISADMEELMNIDGVGEVIARSYTEYFADEDNMRSLEKLLAELKVEKPEEAPLDEESSIAGKTFVITGSVNHFENRNQVKDVIEKLGGKVTGSVSAKTDYLINNDNMSASSKNKKAKELGIPVITEEEFMAMTKIDIV